MAPILEQWRAEKFTLIVSNEIVSEYIEVISRDKFGLPPDVIDDISAYLLRKAEFVTPTEHITAVVSDPDDNKFIEVAVAAQVKEDKTKMLTANDCDGVCLFLASDEAKWITGEVIAVEWFEVSK
ncbi:MAG: PIN domain-containing protein [Chloroflexi bacterium]|nr:PIN domain-containing protein [Chloroflexota bacterium]